MKGKFPVGASLPSTNMNWRWQANRRRDERLRAAYVEAVGREPQNFTEGLAKAQWEYGLQGTPYFRKDARQAVLLLTMAA